MKYLKKFTVKQWKKFDHIVDQEDGQSITGQEIMLRKYEIILTDHQTRAEKFKVFYNKIKTVDIDKTLNKVTKNLDDFHNMMDKMHGIGGPQKDLSALLGKRR